MEYSLPFILLLKMRVVKIKKMRSYHLINSGRDSVLSIDTDLINPYD